uniref:Uncharacterized protein n=1 Tax=Rhizophora mucronata TaxID=61149 RepID=A0A2P2NS76_RHIMU
MDAIGACSISLINSLSDQRCSTWHCEWSICRQAKLFSRVEHGKRPCLAVYISK